MKEEMILESLESFELFLAVTLHVRKYMIICDVM